MLTPEQKALRRKGVTGSELAVILGMTPDSWGSPQDIWEDKLGITDFDLEETYHMKRGRYLEAGIREWLADETGLKIVGSEELGGVHGTLVHPDYPLVIATPDGAAYDKDSMVAAVEIKSPNWGAGWEAPEVRRDGIPGHYLPQVTWEMAVLGVQKCIVGALLFGNLVVYEVPFSSALFMVLLDRARKFWRYVETRTPPPVTSGSSAVKNWLERYYKQGERDEENLLPSTDDIEDHIFKLKLAEENVKASTDMADLARNKIREFIGENDGVVGPWGKITWKTNAKGSRVFRTNWKGEDE
jgi:putative phage-type endonuclease